MTAPTNPPVGMAVPKLQLAAAGVVTGLAGLAVAQATSAILRQQVSPPYAIAEAVRDATPGKLAVSLVHLVGSWDKPLLVGGVILGLIGVSALAGLQTRHSMLRGTLIFVGLAAVSGAIVLSRPQAAPTALVPVLLGAVTWIALLPFLAGVPTPKSATPEAVGATRRVFLKRAGVVVLASMVVGAGGRVFGRKRRIVEAARQQLSLPVTTSPVPAGAEVGLEGMGPWQVPNEDFYRIDTAVVVPAIEAATWSLRIHGMVEKELTITYDDLTSRELTEDWVTLCCVSNTVGGDLIGNAWWSGVRIAELLAEAGPLPGADAVLQTSADGWNCGTPLSALTDDRNALLAVAMNGEPLPLEHGFPVRMVVPGLYGFVSATKWIVDLEVTNYSKFTAFWTSRGWSAEGPIKTQSRIDVPRSNHRVMAGALRVGGTAWAQHTGIEGVEVRVDGGPWTAVELGRVPSEDTWVQWSGTVQVDPGVHSLAVRATDKSGYTQTGVQRDVLPDGATGWHTIEFTAE